MAFFQLNDIVLDVPPTDIKISENRDLVSRPGLRVESPTVLSTVHSVPAVNFTIIFTSNADGNYYDKLLDLISQFRITPFVYVENEYIRDAFSRFVEQKNIALALQRIVVEPVQDLDAISMNVQAYLFNYHPYMPDFVYRSDIFTNTAVRNPQESYAWKLMTMAEKRRRSYLLPGIEDTVDHNGNIISRRASATGAVLDHALNLGAVEYALITQEQYEKLKVDFSAIQRTLDEINANETVYGSEPEHLSNALTNELAKSLPENARGQARARSEELLGVVTSMGKTSGQSATIEDMKASLTDAIAPNTYSMFQYVASNDWEVVTDNEGYPYVFPHLVTTPSVTYKKDPNDPGKSSPQYTYNRIRLSDRSSRKLIAALQQLSTTPKDKILIRRPRHLASGEDRVLLSASVVIEYALAVLPVLGHVYPTFQSLGGPSVSTSFALAVRNGTSLRETLGFLQQQVEQNKYLRFILQKDQNLLVIHQEILKMCGIKTLVYKEHQTETVPGQPDMSIVNISCVETGIDSDTRERLAFEIRNPATDPLLLSGLLDTLAKSLSQKLETRFQNEDFAKVAKYGFKGDFYGVDPSLNAESKKLYHDTVQLYAKEMNELFSHILESIDVRHINFANKLLLVRGEHSTSDMERYVDTNFKEVTIEEVQRYRRYLLQAFEVISPEQVYGIEIIKRDLYKYFFSHTVKPKEVVPVSTRLSNEDGDRASTDIEQGSLPSWLQPMEETPMFSVTDTMRAEMPNISESNLKLLTKQGMIDSLFTNYITNITQFVRQGLIVNGLVFELEELKGFRQAIADTKLGDQLSTYHDFPLSYIAQILSERITPHWGHVYDMLTSQLASSNMLFSNVDISSFLQPDFYLYTPSMADEVNSPGVVNSIKDFLNKQIPESLSEEDEWLSEYYKTKMPADRVRAFSQESEDKIRKLMASIEQEKKEKPANQAKIDRFQKRIDRYRSLNTSLLFDDGMADEETPLYSSLANMSKATDGSEIHGPMVIKEIASSLVSDTEGEAHSFLTFSNTRKGYTMSVGEIAKTIANAYSCRAPNKPIAPDPVITAQVQSGEIINWRWPCDGDVDRCSSGFGERIHPIQKIPKQHNGIDIVARRNQQTSGRAVYAAADGVVSKVVSSATGGGNSVTLTHQPKLNGPVWTSHYMHLLGDEHFNETRLLKGTSVLAGTRIGSIGSTGDSTGAHLHFEIRKDDVPKPPMRGPLWQQREGSDIQKGVLQYDYEPAQSVKPAEHSSVPNPDTSYIGYLSNDISSKFEGAQGTSILRAYPTYRLYFIESDMGERKRFGFDDFYSYSAVLGIQFIANKDIGADLAIIQISNLNGVLSNRKFRGGLDPMAEYNEVGRKATENPGTTGVDTKSENNLASMMLKPGVHIQLKVGYDNNVHNLTTLLNGLITDVAFSDNDEVVTVTCQSYAVELLQNTYGDSSSYGGWFNTSGVTGRIIEDLMSAPEVVHFGRWEGGLVERSQTVKGAVRNVLTNRWTFQPQPQDDNIFAPMGNGVLYGLLDFSSEYVMYQSTIWDVLQEMTLRHPGTIARAVPYEGLFGPRMTLYFGLPDGMYLSRDLRPDELAQLGPEARNVENLEEKEKNVPLTAALGASTGTAIGTLASTALVFIPVVGAPLAAGTIGVTTGFLGFAGGMGFGAKQFVTNTEVTPKLNEAKKTLNDLASKLAFANKVVKPFREYHVLTSKQHILHNDISSSMYHAFNTSTIQYSDDEATLEDELGVLGFGDPKTFTLSCEEGIPDHERREMFAQFPNCSGYEMAKQYSLSLLKRTLGQGYRGTIIVIGNEKIRPHDICFIYDDVANIYGPIEVEQVVHSLTPGGGFITEITPNMVVSVNEHATMSTAEAASHIYEYGLQRMAGNGMLGAYGNAAITSVVNGATALASPLSPIAHMVFNNAEVALGQQATWNPFTQTMVFMLSKFITKSQLRHPFRYIPVMKDGMPLLGGLPSYLEDQGFIRQAGKFIAKYKQNVPLMVSDVYDKIRFSNWAGYSVGDFNTVLYGGTRRNK